MGFQMLNGPDLAWAKMRTHSKALLASEDMDGSLQCATGVLPHSFYTQMKLNKLWVANCSPLPP